MKVAAPVISAGRADAYTRSGLWGQPPLASMLQRHAEEAPARLALVDTFGTSMSYGQLQRAAVAAAAWFSRQGVGAGDAVAITLPNCADYAVAHLALSRLGAVSVMLSAREAAKDIVFAVEHTEPAFVMLSSDSRAQVIGNELSRAGYPLERLLVVDISATEQAEGPTGRQHWPGAAALMLEEATPATAPAHVPTQHDIELVVFSSGTTGQPKGIAHTYLGAGASLTGWIAALGLTWRDSVFCPATLGHVGGSQWGLRTAVTIGAPLIMMDRWNAERAARLIGEYSCTYTLVTPTYVVDLMRLPPELRSLTKCFRTWAVGGSRMSAALIQEAEAALGGQVLRGFGMSECFMVTITRPDDPLEARLRYDGRALPGCEIEVWDEQGHSVRPGTAGEMVVRGPSLIGGYFTDPAESLRTFVDGWQRTGDVVVMQPDGFIAVVDRKKQLIIRGGENIAPQEIEQALSAHPGMPAFVAVGVPDERLGEKVALVYEGGPDDLTWDRIRAAATSAGLARYKWPEVLIPVEQLPRTALGKVQRGGVRRLLAERYEQVTERAD